jgi:predicted RND superfamily exporter protein
MKHFTDFVFRNRRPIIIYLALTVFFAFWIKDIKVASDAITYPPMNENEVFAHARHCI